MIRISKEQAMKLIDNKLVRPYQYYDREAEKRTGGFEDLMIIGKGKSGRKKYYTTPELAEKVKRLS